MDSPAGSGAITSALWWVRMIGRLFWFGIAAATGIVVYRKLSRTVRSHTPSGLADSAQKTASGLLGSVREFMVDVREGTAEREAEIYAALAENAARGSSLAAGRESVDEFDQADEPSELSLPDWLVLSEEERDDPRGSGNQSAAGEQQEGETDR
ncbi:MAG TPA: hypothetical protein VHJ83_10465 [Micromonosporaceae bacterium]|jgi:hypothetical protein|nr:hypothetical protein [Micromonosporaceae bacterium]